MRIKSRAKVGAAYQAKNLPVARQRLDQAGLRLAWVGTDLGFGCAFNHLMSSTRVSCSHQASMRPCISVCCSREDDRSTRTCQRARLRNSRAGSPIRANRLVGNLPSLLIFVSTHSCIALAPATASLEARSGSIAPTSNAAISREKSVSSVPFKRSKVSDCRALFGDNRAIRDKIDASRGERTRASPGAFITIFSSKRTGILRESS